MPEPVFNMLDKRLWLSGLSQDYVCYLDISPLITTADIINLTLFPIMQNDINSRTVIINIYPVTNVHTISIKRKLLPLNSICYKKRDQLFRILIRTEVVGAPCNNHRQMIRSPVGMHNHVRPCL